MSEPKTNAVALPALLLEAIKLHEDNLAILLKKYNLERKDVVKVYMAGEFVSIDPRILREFHYIDAYARVLSQAAYAPADKADWTPRDHIKALFDDVYEWAQNQQEMMEFHLATQEFKGIEASKQQMYESVLLAALMKDDLTDDQQRRLTAPDPGASPES